MKSSASTPQRRSLGDACREAWPDALAAIACAIGWARPDAPGFDLLATSGLLYFIELPLAAIAAIAIVRRIRHPDWSRRDKLRYVLIPTLLLAWIGGSLFGLAGLVAILWLGGRTVAHLLRDAPADDDGHAMMWLQAQRLGTRLNFTLLPHRPAEPPPRALLIPAGHEHIMAFATAALWLLILIVIAFLPPLGTGGATADYAASVGWQDTVVGREIPAHIALAAGLLLFGARTLLHFEGAGAPEPEPPCIEDDEVLREVIEKVEGRLKNKRRK